MMSTPVFGFTPHLIFKEGLEDGFREGLEKGRADGNAFLRQTAERMSRKGFSEAAICEVLHIDAEKLLGLMAKDKTE